MPDTPATGRSVPTSLLDTPQAETMHDSVLPIRNWMLSDEFYEGLDPGIRFAVRLLHANGIETGQSCEGGEGHAYDWPSIDLNGQPDDASGFAALAVLATYRLPVWRIEYVWTVSHWIPSPDSFWRIVFREPMHERANDQPMFVRHYRYNVAPTSDAADSTLAEMLAEVYLPDGAVIWMTTKHQQFGGMTVEEMRSAGRFDEVLAAAERLVTRGVS